MGEGNKRSEVIVQGVEERGFSHKEDGKFVGDAFLSPQQIFYRKLSLNIFLGLKYKFDFSWAASAA